MIMKTWMALALGTALLAGGVSAFSALGATSGTCDQTMDQDRLQLKDGTGDNCTCDCTDPASLVAEGSLTEDDASEADDAADCDCNETEDCVLYDYLYSYDFLYNTTDLVPPYQSACGQEL